MRSSIDEIRRQDETIRAWAHLLETAPAPLQGGGALEGLTFGVKDVMDVRGMPTRYGANLPDAAPAHFDAACVAVLRQAGATPLGKTITAEFAYTAPGPTRNPRHLDHTPGGSSSGSAAAVAAGMVDFAVGTQTGGSIIRPAAFTGVVGFKPTFGRVPRTGMLVSCDSLDTIGWFATDVALCQRVAGVFMAGQSGARPASFQSVAVLPCPQAGTLSREARMCLDHAASTLRNRHAQVDYVDLGDWVAEALAVHNGIMKYEISRGLLPVLQAEPQALRQQTRDVIEQGLQVTPAEYAALGLRRRRLHDAWLDRLQSYDVILTPSAAGAAPLGLDSTGTSVFNRIWSLLGWPALHLPTAVTGDGLPLGVQCVGFPGRDMTLLSAAAELHPLIDQR